MGKYNRTDEDWKEYEKPEELPEEPIIEPVVPFDPYVIQDFSIEVLEVP